MALQKLANDDEAAVSFIETETDFTNKLWQEVLENRLNRKNLASEVLADELAQADTPHNTEDWQTGALILIDAGTQKIKVAQVVKKYWA